MIFIFPSSFLFLFFMFLNSWTLLNIVNLLRFMNFIKIHEIFIFCEYNIYSPKISNSWFFLNRFISNQWEPFQIHEVFTNMRTFSQSVNLFEIHQIFLNPWSFLQNYWFVFHIHEHFWIHVPFFNTQISFWNTCIFLCF